MLDLLLICSLGFLGSFGHCAGMCGPITAAFALSSSPAASQLSASQETAPEETASQASTAVRADLVKADLQQQTPSQKLRLGQVPWQAIRFHLLLNVGRVLSYVLTGLAIGALGSVLIAGGQFAGVGSLLRQGMTLLTGGLLVWFGLAQLQPNWLPKLPILHPLLQGNWHQRLSQQMVSLSLNRHWWTPFCLGMVWGLVPCGFLYAAQIKAAATSHPWLGAATMLAFGLGTMPTMLGVGLSTALMSADRRSQLFRMGGWVTLTIGVLTLLRTGDTMVDYTGHAALICLLLALVARPISRIWATPLHYRRGLGVGAFLLSLLHVLHMAEHSWQWNLEAVSFMLPQHQWSIAAGTLALILMLPAALTSFDWAQRKLGWLWRQIHLLAVPALILAAVHTVLIGSHYLGSWQLTIWNRLAVGALTVAVISVLLLRQHWIWRLLFLEKYYASEHSHPHQTSGLDQKRR